MSGVAGPLRFNQWKDGQPTSGIETWEGDMRKIPSQTPSSTQVIVGIDFVRADYSGAAGLAGIRRLIVAEYKDVANKDKWTVVEDGSAVCWHWDAGEVSIGKVPGYALTRLEVIRCTTGGRKAYRVIADWSFLTNMQKTPLAGPSAPDPVRRDVADAGDWNGITDVFGQPQGLTASKVFINQLEFGWSCTSHGDGWIRDQGLGGIQSVMVTDLTPYIDLINRSASDGNTIAAGCCQKNYTRGENGLDVAVCNAIGLMDENGTVNKSACETCQNRYCRDDRLEEEGCFTYCNGKTDGTCDASLRKHCADLYAANSAKALESNVCANYMPDSFYKGLADEFGKQLDLKPGAFPANPACVYPKAASGLALKPAGYKPCQLNLQSCKSTVGVSANGSTFGGTVGITSQIKCSQDIGGDKNPAPPAPPAPSPEPSPAPKPVASNTKPAAAGNANASTNKPSKVTPANSKTETAANDNTVLGKLRTLPPWAWWASGGVLALILLGLIALAMRSKKPPLVVSEGYSHSSQPYSRRAAPRSPPPRSPARRMRSMTAFDSVFGE
jgi:hypothetical protein